MRAIKPYSQTDLKKAINELATTFSDRIHLTHATRKHHSGHQNYQESMIPDAVIYPFSNEEVALIISLCNTYKIPVIPFGAGTSIDRSLNAVKGGISIDLSEMNQIIEINAVDKDCRVQAGVTQGQLNKALHYDNLFLSVDAGDSASIGGMAATCASGLNSIKYGTMKSAVLGLTAVTASGEIIKTGSRTHNSLSGYDITQLLVGSQGTLAVITEIELRLHTKPIYTKTAVCSFKSLSAAADTVINAIQLSIPIARIELLSSMQAQASSLYSDLDPLSAKPTLFLEFHGTEQDTSEHITLFNDISNQFGGSEYIWVPTEKRNTLWQACHNAYHALQQSHVNSKIIAAHICVPVSLLAKSISATEQDAENSQLPYALAGHIGEGSYHLFIITTPNNKDHLTQSSSLRLSIQETTIKLGGIYTENIGTKNNKGSLLYTTCEASAQIEEKIKTALDPNNIMNPS